jgi:uncharacterized protein
VYEIQFEWDEAKNRVNQRKHGISFELAREAFRDPLRVSRIDRIVSGEERWQTFGMVDGVLLLLIVHTTWDELELDIPVECVRIISVRRATSTERKSYEEGR